MRIAEIYKSVQGEGLLTGTESLFVRTSGCNLRCWFCDTRFTSWEPEGDDLAVDEILRQAAAYSCQHVVLTGGEPMLFAELIPLCEGFRRAGRHITVETAGTLHLPVACDLMSISPKLANSTPSARLSPAWHTRHEQARHRPEVVRRLLAEYPWQLKFVVDTPDDLPDIEQYLNALPQLDRARVLLMPQGVTADELEHRRAWLAPYCASHNLVYCPRRHIEWFGHARGT